MSERIPTSPPDVIGGVPTQEIGRRVKVELRDRMRRIRKTIGEAARRERSERIAARVIELEAWQRANTVALFVPMRTEVDVTLLAEAAWKAGKRVAAPRMIDDPSSDPSAPPRLMLELRAWVRGVETVESGRMVREPPADAPLLDPADIDLVIVPALALDVHGGRLGYGAGLYDGLLPKLRATRVGIAFSFQLLAELPMAPHDQRVHWVITDERTLVIEGRQPP